MKSSVLNKTCIIKNTDELIYNKTCLISGETLNEDMIYNNNVIKLRCGHSFKYDLFIKSLNQMNKKSEGFYKCPYCMDYIEKIPCNVSRNIVNTALKNAIIADKIRKKKIKNYPFVCL